MKNIGSNIRFSAFAALILVVCLFGIGHSQQRDTVWIWYGNTSLNPISANIGDTLFVDVFAKTAPAAYVADMHLALGADNQYIDTMISQSFDSLFYPLTDWDVAYFLTQQGSPPNQSGWSSQPFQGFARIASYDAPWLHVEIPWKILTEVVVTANDPGLAGRTVAAFGPGLSIQSGPSNAGDTLGGVGYEVIESFCQVSFFQEVGFISGAVENQSGSAIENVKIKIAGTEDSTFTDSNGDYNFTLSPGIYNLLFSHEAYIDTTITGVQVTLNNTTTVDLTMRVLPGGTVFGTVVDTTGLAIAGVSVADGSGFNEVLSDGDGDYSLDLPQGSYAIHFSKTGYLDTSVTGIFVLPDSSVELNMTMIPGLNYNPDTPAQIIIMPNYPNPFNAGTRIDFELDRPLDVVVEIFDILGRRVQKVADIAGHQGMNTVIWYPGEIASGIYFCRIRSGDVDESRAMLFIK